VVFLEDLKANSRAALSKCMQHIGLDEAKYPGENTINLNSGDEKLYDTLLFRFLRTNRFTGPPLSKLAGPEQDRIFAPLRLRRSFGKRSLRWDKYSLDVYREEIVPDSLKFLDFYGKPASFWGLDKVA
jgi:hypothetical protein